MAKAKSQFVSIMDVPCRRSAISRADGKNVMPHDLYLSEMVVGGFAKQNVLICRWCGVTATMTDERPVEFGVAV